MMLENKRSEFEHCERDGSNCASVKVAPLFLMFRQYLAQVQWAEKKRREGWMRDGDGDGGGVGEV